MTKKYIEDANLCLSVCCEDTDNDDDSGRVFLQLVYIVVWLLYGKGNKQIT